MFTLLRHKVFVPNLAGHPTSKWHCARSGVLPLPCCLIVALLMATLPLAAQTSRAVWGRVVDATTLRPVRGVTVRWADSSLMAVSDSLGRFRLPSSSQHRLLFRHTAYRPLLTALRADSTYQLTPTAVALDDVVVTATESKTLAATSRIGLAAMRHIQPSSFADLLALLPGGTTADPQLTQSATIHLREAAPVSSAFDTGALGTRFLVDGAPISTQAQMLQLNGSSEPMATSRSTVNAGVDLRALSTDDIASVEVVRGVPSVEYGELTSGLVKIERKRGGNALQARLKADETSKLFHLSKGVEVSPHVGFNFSAGWLSATADPRQPLTTYSRLTLTALAQGQQAWRQHRLTWKASADFTGSFDAERRDPDLNYGTEDRFRQRFQRWALAASARLMLRNKWWRSVEWQTAVSFQSDAIHRYRLVQLSQLTAAATSTVSGESDAVILPYTYYAHHRVSSKPLSAQVKAQGVLVLPFLPFNHSFKVGSEWSVDKNFGRGQDFDVTRPAFPGLTTRLRPLSHVPAAHIWAFYAEHHLSLPLARHRLTADVGARAQTLLHLPQDYALHSRPYVDPRINAGWQLPSLTVGAQPLTLRLNAGWGWQTKFPTLDQLFPDPLYVDLVELNYYNAQPDLRRIHLRTYVEDVANRQLKPARNEKREWGVDVAWKGYRLTLTFFRENMTDGFREQTLYTPFAYQRYDASGIDATTLTAAPSLAALPSTTVTELYGTTVWTNGSQLLKQGVEYTFSTPRFAALHTRLTVTGAYFRTTYRNSLSVMYRPSVVVLGERYRYAGVYHDNDGYLRKRWNTHFTLDTSLPKLRLGFSVTAECTWFSSSRRLPVSNAPEEYMDEQGTLHAFAADAASNAYLAHLLRQYSPSLFALYREPFFADVHLKVTKQLLRDRLRLAMFCHRLLDYHPSYTSGGVTIRRHVNPYFGLEASLTL